MEIISKIEKGLELKIERIISTKIEKAMNMKEKQIMSNLEEAHHKYTMMNSEDRLNKWECNQLKI